MQKNTNTNTFILIQTYKANIQIVENMGGAFWIQTNLIPPLSNMVKQTRLDVDFIA